MEQDAAVLLAFLLRQALGGLQGAVAPAAHAASPYRLRRHDGKVGVYDMVTKMGRYDAIAGANELAIASTSLSAPALMLAV